MAFGVVDLYGEKEIFLVQGICGVLDSSCMSVFKTKRFLCWYNSWSRQGVCSDWVLALSLWFIYGSTEAIDHEEIDIDNWLKICCDTLTHQHSW